MPVTVNRASQDEGSGATPIPTSVPGYTLPCLFFQKILCACAYACPHGKNDVYSLSFRYFADHACFCELYVGISYFWIMVGSAVAVFAVLLTLMTALGCAVFLKVCKRNKKERQNVELFDMTQNPLYDHFHNIVSNSAYGQIPINTKHYP